MRTPALLAVTALVAFVAAGGAALASSRPDGAVWRLGGNDARLFQADGEQSLQAVAGTFDVRALRVVSGGSDANLELEHDPGAVASELRALGATGRPTPLRLGLPDGQDVTAVVVTGNAVTGTGPKTTDVQSWQMAGRTSSRIDRLGRLRVNGIALVPTVAGNGTVRLEAILPDGSRQLLVPAAR